MIVVECCGQKYFADRRHAALAIRCHDCRRLLVGGAAADREQPAGSAPAPTRARKTSAAWTIALTAVSLSLATVAAYRGTAAPQGQLSPIEKAMAVAETALRPTAEPKASAGDLPVSPESRLLAAAASRPQDAELTALYDSLNTRHFAGALPRVRVLWDANLEQLDRGVNHLNGLTNGTEILIRPSLKAEAADVRRALCHEMVHVKLHSAESRVQSHGPVFQDELRRVNSEGCFDAIWSTDRERADLKRWIDAERTRLERVNQELEATKAAAARERDEVNAAVNALNERTRLSGAQPAAPPPTGEERQELSARLRRAEQDFDAFNGDLRRFNEAVAHLNQQIERFKLMEAYPYGVDEPAWTSTPSA